MLRIFDPYAIALSFLVGGVGFGMTFFFNTRVSEWGMQEVAYPAMAMVYVYARNARFFDNDRKVMENIIEGSSTDVGTPASTEKKAQAPPLDAPGLVLVKGAPLTAPKDGSLAVVFFFSTWCVNCELCLPAILAMATQYHDEGVTFAGVTQEKEDDLRYFVEAYQRPIRSVTFLADEQGTLTEGYRGARGTKTIPHCYVVRGEKGGGPGVVEWHGHPTRLEAALGYLLDCGEEEAEGGVGWIKSRCDYGGARRKLNKLVSIPQAMYGHAS